MQQIAEWLERLGLSEYAQRFNDNAIDLSVIRDLTEQDLKDLGVLLGHRRKILRAVAELDRAAPASIETANEPMLRDEAERRHLTVMICDLVGSTALSARLDPEDMRAVIDAYHAACARITRTYDGFLAEFRGDGILAYFGYPRAHEDDAERTVRAGLDIIASVAQLQTRAAEPLAVRIGIATGLVVVGDPSGMGALREHALVGDAPNLAARLQALAEPGTIVVAASTRRLLGDLFRLRDLGRHEVKGIAEPVTAWAVEGVSASESRFEAVHAAGLTDLIGRENELHFLLERQRLAWKGEGQIVLISGEPGIGKSRLAAALAERIAGEPHARLRYQCSPYETNSALRPFIAQLERAAGLKADDTSEQRLDKLEAVLAVGASQVETVVPLFAALLSIPFGGRYPPLAVSPAQQRRRTLAALLDQFEARAHLQPILLSFEDAHWADATSLELLDLTVKRVRKLPVLALFTFRPEFEPPWAGLPNVSTLTLGRLDRNDVESIVARVTGGRVPPPEVMQQIVDKTDGNPLFVEELTKAVLETGILVEDAEGYRLAGPLPPLAIPATLQDSLMARLDRLAPVKEIGQIGAAIGREFSYSLLRVLVGRDDAELKIALAQLEQAGLVFRRGEPPEAVYSFKHALVRDAAYESLLKSRRQLLHGQIARALEERFADIVASQPEIVAHHFTEAGLAEPAIDYLQRAGHRAIQRSANTEAIGHLKHALELLHSLSKNPERARTELELEVLLGQAMIAGRGYAANETKEVLLRAKNLIDKSTTPSQKFAILYGIWACYYVGGEVSIRAAAEEFLAEAERHDDTAALCLSHRTLGTTLVTTGDFVGGRRHLERAQALYEPVKHAPFRYQYGQDIGAATLCYLCWALWHLGFAEQASDVAAEAMALAEALSHPHTLSYTICHARGMLDVCRGRTEDMRSYASAAVALSTEHGFPFWAAGGQILEGWAITCEGRADQGLELLEEGLSAWQATGARLWLPIFLALKAQAQAKAGRCEAALQTIEQAIAISNKTSERWAIAEVLRLKAGLLLATGRARRDEVEALLVDSLEVARRQKAHSWELRTACDLARLWRREGRCEEAVKLLQASYDQFTEGFETPDLMDAKVLLEQMGR